MMKKFIYFAPAFAWGIFIFILSVLPGQDLPHYDWGDLVSIDKLVHMVFYALLTWLVLRGIKKLNPRQNWVRVGLIVALSTSAFGWFIEWLQENYCQNRMFDWFDGLANMVGAGLAFGTFIYRKNIIKTRS